MPLPSSFHLDIEIVPPLPTPCRTCRLGVIAYCTISQTQVNGQTSTGPATQHTLTRRTNAPFGQKFIYRTSRGLGNLEPARYPMGREESLILARRTATAYADPRLHKRTITSGTGSGWSSSGGKDKCGRFLCVNLISG